MRQAQLILRQAPALGDFFTFSSLSCASRNLCNDTISSLFDAENNIKLIKML
jgi:hypothetical protein